LSRTPPEVQGPPPIVGRHTRDVLASLLGLSEAGIDAAYGSGAAVEGQDLPDELTDG
jgi:crotonobetainyl-CoA:carnitine CoA-transferase CaiB-like acyl-CoA transferase